MPVTRHPRTEQKCVQRMVLAAPCSVSIGEAQEIFLVDGIKDL